MTLHESYLNVILRIIVTLYEGYVNVILRIIVTPHEGYVNVILRSIVTLHEGYEIYNVIQFMSVLDNRCALKVYGVHTP